MFVCLGQLLAQFECTALLSCPLQLHMHMYMFLCFVHGQIKWWWWWWWLLFRSIPWLRTKFEERMYWGLIVRTINFQDLQPTGMWSWSWSTNVADMHGRTTSSTCDCKTALSLSVLLFVTLYSPAVCRRDFPRPRRPIYSDHLTVDSALRYNVIT